MTAEQAYINGFVKRASEYGFDEYEAVDLLKRAMTDKEKLENATDSTNELSPLMQGLYQIGLPPINHMYHGYKDITESDKDMPNRTPRILGGTAAGTALGAGAGILAKALSYGALRKDPTAAKMIMAFIGSKSPTVLGSLGGGLGAAYGASKYNDAKEEYIKKLKERMLEEQAD